jgi:hypothetical protein
MKTLLCPLLILFMIIPRFLYGGTTGKIAGILKDASTGEPLVPRPTSMASISLSMYDPAVTFSVLPWWAMPHIR